MMQHIHLIGIGGSGLSAIARVLLESGYTVSGSDRQLSVFANELAQSGAQVFEGHRAGQIAGADVVVRSSAIGDDNIEVQAARSAGIPVLKRSEFLGQLFPDKSTLAIAGTHGKTTTTAMAAWVFHSLGADPSYIIGGVSKNLSRNAHAGQGKHFIVEADEYDRMFLGLSPEWILITHLEHDHPDCYPTMNEYRQAFVDFLQRLKPGGGLITCLDHPETAGLVWHLPPGRKAWTYGLSEMANYFTEDISSNTRGGTDFKACYHENEEDCSLMTAVELQVPGLHNVRNALAVLALVHRMGLPVKLAAQALSEFSGTKRRFELMGEVNGITIYSDYAHHPTEIRVNLAAARQRYPQRRIWAIWQPHTYSRTQALFDAFIQSFQHADRVVVTEIYAARESNPGISAARIVAEMKQPPTWFAPTLEDAVIFLLDELQSGDVVLILSAGDADQIGLKLLEELGPGEEEHV